MKKALITGVTGQDGSYLAERLLDEGTTVHGLVQSRVESAAFAEVGIEDWRSYVRQDPKFFRPAEVDLLIGDAGKARAQLGWEPQVSFSDLVTMMVDADLDEQRALAGR